MLSFLLSLTMFREQRYRSSITNRPFILLVSLVSFERIIHDSNWIYRESGGYSRRIPRRLTELSSGRSDRFISSVYNEDIREKRENF